MNTKKTNLRKSDVSSDVTSYVSSNVSNVGSNVNSYVSESQIISILQGYGFEVKSKYIYKRSEQNRLEVCGNFNDNSIYLHATNNIYPFESGISYSFKTIAKGFNTTLISDFELQRISQRRAKEKEKEKTKKVIDFNEYLETTNEKHNFNLQFLLDSFHQKNKDILIPFPTKWVNDNNVRGKWNKTYFPLLDKNEKLITAQIIEYKSDLKRNRNSNPYFLQSSGKIGLYRRNLYNETQKTIIVESPKLAELGAMMIPKFNWMATFGKEKLNTLDLSFLDSKNTFVLPDFDAFESWRDIAINKWNFGVIDIFQKEIEKLSEEEKKQYSDFADLILPYLQFKCDSKVRTILYKIYSSLVYLELEDEYSLAENSPEIESYNTELGFQEKKRKNIKFVSSIPKDFCENTKGLYKQSAEGGYSIKTEFIEVFTSDFELISASFDICKEQTEKEFIYNLQKCFRVLRYLNQDTYLALFDVILSHIQTKGNYLFNQRYVRDVLIDKWEEIDVLHIEDIIKKRNFNYLGGADFNNYEFLAEIRKAKKLYKIHSELIAVKEIIKSSISSYRFIEKSELGLKKEVGNEYIFNLINRFNIASIGSIDKRIAKVVKTLVMFNITIYKGYYLFYNDKISINEVSKKTGINRVTLGNLLKFERNTDIIENIIEEIDYLIDNYNSFDIEKVEIKGKKYNSVVPVFKEVASLKHISLKDAFDCDLDLSNSILNCDIDEAYNRGMDFYVSWYLFQNNVTNEEDRSYIISFRYDLFHRNWNPMEQLVA